MKNITSHKILRAVLVLSIVVFLLSVIGVTNYVTALKQVISQDIEIDGWSIFVRSAFVVAAEGLSAAAAAFYILRGSILEAHNFSGIFLVVMAMALLLRVPQIAVAPVWQIVLAAAWLSFLAWLLWRVVPNTSLNPDAATRHAG